jgi:hypothetical protein
MVRAGEPEIGAPRQFHYPGINNAQQLDRSHRANLCFLCFKRNAPLGLLAG